MVMDLNKIAVYGTADGTISEQPQREIFSLCDGIVGGQGDGPLNPEPLPLGIISFSNDSSMNDICMATIMGFEINKISLLRSANLHVQEDSIDLTLNKRRISLSDLSTITILTTPPPGWADHLSEK